MEGLACRSAGQYFLVDGFSTSGMLANSARLS